MSDLPSRYEIRRLDPQHAQWAAAIVIHSNAFHSSVFPVVYPDAKGARFNKAMKACEYLIDHQINSGLSYGVFDKEFAYKKTGSAATHGKFYWDPENDELTGSGILEAMDFPLVSVALAYDGFDALDMSRLEPLVAALPIFASVYQALDKLDPRPPETWRFPQERNTLLMRNATSTRHEYEGKGLMGALARHLMKTAAEKGYHQSNIECLSDRVTYVWSKPPSPFSGKVIASFRSEDWEEKDAEGNVTKPFYPAKQLVTRVCTTFSDKA
ncbi:unnamed protein product [Discula destructiva]